MAKEAIQYVRFDAIKPYEKNPRINEKSVPKVAESIKRFGFLQPIVVDGDGVILAGHTRYEAARFLGLKEVPVLYARELTEAQAKAYRLADNKAGEDSQWDNFFLYGELNDIAALDFDMADFGFDVTELDRRKASWKHTEKRCGLKKKIKQSSHGEFMVTSFFEVGKAGKSIAEIKEDKSNVGLFADNLCDYVNRALGLNLSKGSWCIVTTPRRRHTEGFHFSTEICKAAAKSLGLPFYEGAFTARTRDRITPEFEMVCNPVETNIILYDDVISTGVTLQETRRLLIDAGHVTLIIVGIFNHGV